MAITTRREDRMASPYVTSVPRPEWSPAPHEGCHNVQGKVLLKLDHLAVAMLRFGPHGTIHEHAAGWDIDVVCLEGRGMTSVDGDTAAIREGHSVRWPAGAQHRLWTDEDKMVTLMIEHVGG
jgi:quercetin dioxygenase-like cupin family protein